MRGCSAALAVTLLSAPVAMAAETRGLRVELRASEAAEAPVAETVELYGASHALVIGIDTYTNGWPRLSNAVKDARLVAVELRSRGFDVTLKTDVKSTDMRRAFERNRNLSTTLRHRRFLFTDSFLLLWKWRVG